MSCEIYNSCVARMMERENKKARDDARKTYNDSVRV